MNYVAYLMTQELTRRQFEDCMDTDSVEPTPARTRRPAWRRTLARLLRETANALEPQHLTGSPST